RGASRRDLLKLAVVESLAIGVVAGLLGAGAALLAVSLLVSGGAHLTLARGLITTAVCVLVAGAGAAAARLAASHSSLRATVAEGRLTAVRERRPLWQRLYVDLAAL